MQCDQSLCAQGERRKVEEAVQHHRNEMTNSDDPWVRYCASDAAAKAGLMRGPRYLPVIAAATATHMDERILFLRSALICACGLGRGNIR